MNIFVCVKRLSSGLFFMCVCMLCFSLDIVGLVTLSLSSFLSLFPISRTLIFTLTLTLAHIHTYIHYIHVFSRVIGSIISKESFPNKIMVSNEWGFTQIHKILICTQYILYRSSYWWCLLSVCLFLSTAFALSFTQSLSLSLSLLPCCMWLMVYYVCKCACGFLLSQLIRMLSLCLSHLTHSLTLLLYLCIIALFSLSLSPSLPLSPSRLIAENVEKLFERCLIHCLDVELWKTYIRYIRIAKVTYQLINE